MTVAKVICYWLGETDVREQADLHQCQLHSETVCGQVQPHTANHFQRRKEHSPRVMKG